MKHLKQQVELANDLDIHNRKMEQAQSLIRDIRNAPMRRGIKLVDRSARAAVSLGDPEGRPAPTFYLSADQFHELYSASWTDYDPNLLAPPFNAFYIKPDTPMLGFRRDGDSATEGEQAERFDGLYLYNDDNHFWIIGDIAVSSLVVDGYAFGRLMESYIARTNEDLCVADADIQADGKYVGLSICDRAEFEGALADYAGAQKAARALVTFLLALNNRDVEVTEIHPANRAERKRTIREGVKYRINIPRSIKQVVSEVQSRTRLGVRVAHQVRGHLRHYKSGKTAWIRQHFRGGIPDRFRDYDTDKVDI